MRDVHFDASNRFTECRVLVLGQRRRHLSQGQRLAQIVDNVHLFDKGRGRLPKGDYDSASASFESESMTTKISGGGSLVVLISYYNLLNRYWHPMCTEWALDASVQGSISSESELHFILTAAQALDLTANHGLLEVMASVGGAWKRRAASHKTKQIPDDDTMRGKTDPCNQFHKAIF
ncbi:hypothetical protein PsorP6_019441 [Peronosclerospora sorghi]|nr:hypothetical protein PsorP6_019441 [Peronosclerospora sorghi]